MFEMMRPYNNRKNNRMAYYDPFRAMEDLERNFWNDDFDFFKGGFGDFKTDIKDNDKEYVLQADLPGFDKKDIHIDIDGDRLTINAERHSECEQNDEKNKFVRCERSYGSYSRSFDISSVKADEIKAKYENGVLQLSMPKQQEQPASARHLEIE